MQKLEKFLSNPGKVHSEGLVNLLRYIRDNKTLGFKYYADMNDAHSSDLSRQANIKTENQLMDFSDYIWRDFPDTGRSTGAYIIFDQDGPIEHGTHFPVQISKPSTESEYNAAFTAGMDFTHFRILIHEFLNKDPDIFLEEAPIICH